jgi:hypothetical protein
MKIYYKYVTYLDIFPTQPLNRVEGKEAVIMSTVASLNPDAKSDLRRNVADFQPSVWGDYFLQYASDSMVCKIIIFGLKYK